MCTQASPALEGAVSCERRGAGSWHDESQRKCVARVRSAPVGSHHDPDAVVGHPARATAKVCTLQRSPWLLSEAAKHAAAAMRVGRAQSLRSPCEFPPPSETSTVCSRPSAPALQDAVSLSLSAALDQVGCSVPFAHAVSLFLATAAHTEQVWCSRSKEVRRGSLCVRAPPTISPRTHARVGGSPQPHGRPMDVARG